MNTPTSLIDPHAIVAGILPKLIADNPDPEALQDACRHEMGQLMQAAAILADGSFSNYYLGRAAYIKALKGMLARLQNKRASKNR